MNVVVIIVAGLILFTVIVRFIRTRTARTDRVTVADVPRILAAVSIPTSRPTFAVLLFNTSDRPAAEDAVSVQFGIDKGHVGLDWVLSGRRMVEDRDRFLNFARGEGFAPELKQMNGVNYARVEDGDLARLAHDVITKLYKMPADQSIQLIVEGFDWETGRRNLP